MRNALYSWTPPKIQIIDAVRFFHGHVQKTEERAHLAYEREHQVNSTVAKFLSEMAGIACLGFGVSFLIAGGYLVSENPGDDVAQGFGIAFLVMGSLCVMLGCALPAGAPETKVEVGAPEEKIADA